MTKKIEDAVAGLGNIDYMISTVSNGNFKTTINFILGTNSDRATNDVRNAIALIRQDLPQDINDPIVERLEFSGVPLITYAVKSDQHSVEQLSNLVDQRLTTMAIALAFFLASLMLVPLIPKGFVDDDNFQNWIMHTLRYGFGKKPQCS